jgi:hypothetical protein
MPIELISPDAAPEERQRALAAALEVFRVNRIHPEAAALGKEEVALYEMRGKRGPVPKEEAFLAAKIFDEASSAAFYAGGERWNAGLECVMEEGSYWAEYVEQSPVHQWIDPEDEGRPAS